MLGAFFQLLSSRSVSTLDLKGPSSSLSIHSICSYVLTIDCRYATFPNSDLIYSPPSVARRERKNDICYGGGRDQRVHVVTAQSDANTHWPEKISKPAGLDQDMCSHFPCLPLRPLSYPAIHDLRLTCTDSPAVSRVISRCPLCPLSYLAVPDLRLTLVQAAWLFLELYSFARCILCHTPLSPTYGSLSYGQPGCSSSYIPFAVSSVRSGLPSFCQVMAWGWFRLHPNPCLIISFPDSEPAAASNETLALHGPHA